MRSISHDLSKKCTPLPTGTIFAIVSCNLLSYGDKVSGLKQIWINTRRISHHLFTVSLWKTWVTNAGNMSVDPAGVKLYKYLFTHCLQYVCCLVFWFVGRKWLMLVSTEIWLLLFWLPEALCDDLCGVQWVYLMQQSYVLLRGLFFYVFSCLKCLSH